MFEKIKEFYNKRIKGLLTNTLFVLVSLLVLYVIFLRECRSENYYIGKDNIVVSKAEWDSVCNVKSDTIFITVSDTIIIQKPVYIIKYLPTPIVDNTDGVEFSTDSLGNEIVEGENINHYKDSIVNDSIRIFDELWVSGVIERWDRMYEPVIHTVTKEIIVTVPKVVTETVYVGNNGLYLSGLVGGNYNHFVPGVSIDYITKKSNLYGLQYQRFGNENIYSFKMGVRFSIFKRKN